MSEAGGREKLRTLIEFDHRQVVFTTNDSELMRLVVEAHSAMIVASESRAVGYLEILRDADGYRIEADKPFAVACPAAALMDYVMREILACFVRSRENTVWFHAGVVEREGEALLLAGPSGAGKSTLTTLLTKHGWGFLSDEVAPVDLATKKVLPYPRTPIARLGVGGQQTRGELFNLTRVSWSVPYELVVRTPIPITSIAFPVFSPLNVTEYRRIDEGQASLELLRNCSNFDSYPAEAVELSAYFGSWVSCGVLTYCSDSRATDVVSALGF